MKDFLNKRFSKPDPKRSVFYFLKAIVLVGILFLFNQQVNTLDSLTLALFWATTSALLTIAFAYPFIIKKKNTKEMFQDGSNASRVINGRFIRLTVCFILSAFLAATLLTASQKWNDSEWILVWLSILIYFVISLRIDKVIKPEYKPQYQLRGLLIGSRISTAIVLTLFFTIMFLYSNVSNPLTFGEAFSETKLLFADSSSPLLTELGKLTYLMDGYTTYLIAPTSALSCILYVALIFTLYVSPCFALAFLLSFAALRLNDLKQVFLPIEEFDNGKLRKRIILKSAGSILAFACIFVCVFLYVDDGVKKAKEAGGYTAMEQFVQNCANIYTYNLDGKKYDATTINKEINKNKAANDNYIQKRTALEQAYNEAIETCKGNVAAYLDWRYRDFFDDAVGVFFDTVRRAFDPNDEKDREDFQQKITENVDFNKIELCVNEYNQAVDELKQETIETLPTSDIYEIPIWLTKGDLSLDEYFQSLYIDPTFHIEYPKEGMPSKEDARRAILNSINQKHSQLMTELQENMAL